MTNDFFEVMDEADRLCNSFDHCSDCPFYNDITGMDICGMKHEIFEDPKQFYETVREWSNAHPRMECDAYNHGYCMSTKECDACNCNGDRRKCDFYPDKRGETK